MLNCEGVYLWFSSRRPCRRGVVPLVVILNGADFRIDMFVDKIGCCCIIDNNNNRHN